MLTREDLIVRMRRYLGKEVCISPGLRGDIELCVEALAALSPPVTADGEMPVEPKLVTHLRGGNLTTFQKEAINHIDALRTFALREHQGRRAAEGENAQLRRLLDRGTPISEYERRQSERAGEAESRAADLERRSAERNEFDSQQVSVQLDPSVGVPWMRCSPGLPEYVADLERRVGEAHEAHADCRTMLEGEHDAHMECHARAEKAEGDARRYRWLRDSSIKQYEHPIVVSQDSKRSPRYLGPLFGKILDAAIDTALTAQSVEAGKEGGEG